MTRIGQFADNYEMLGELQSSQRSLTASKEKLGMPEEVGETLQQQAGRRARGRTRREHENPPESSEHEPLSTKG